MIKNFINWKKMIGSTYVGTPYKPKNHGGNTMGF